MSNSRCPTPAEFLEVSYAFSNISGAYNILARTFDLVLPASNSRSAFDVFVPA